MQNMQLIIVMNRSHIPAGTSQDPVGEPGRETWRAERHLNVSLLPQDMQALLL